MDSDDDDSDRDRRPGSLDSDSDSNSSSDTEDDDDGQISSVPDGSAAQKQGPIDKVRDYRRRDKRLHRQHRGLMQWKVSSRILVQIPRGFHEAIFCLSTFQRGCARN